MLGSDHASVLDRPPAPGLHSIRIGPIIRPMKVDVSRISAPVTIVDAGMHADDCRLCTDRRAFFAAVAGLLAGAAVSFPVMAEAARGVELLMFDDVGCPWCRRWREEVGPAYSNSPEGKRAPLRSIALRGGIPSDIKLASAVRATPTFVLVQDGREVGRITGYPGPDFFWSALGELMKKLRDGRPA